ncbi:MAG: hypothetical protein ABJA16_01070, partial [Nakamurella sp.]
MTLARRLWWLLAALLVLGTTTPAAAAHLRAPQGEFAGTLRFEIDSVTPALVTDTSSSIGISGRMINTGSEELTGVVARWQRGAAFTSTAGVRAEIAEPGQPEAVLTTFGPVTDTIAAGGTVPFTLKTDAFVRDRGGLGIQAPGVYPVMLNVNASFASGPASGARVGELHVLLTVASVPDGTNVVGTRQPVAMLMPLVDRPHRDPTGAFFDDDLTPLISTGGRLADVLAAAEAPGLPAGAVTLAVDPELLEELQLMGAGYTVGPYLFDITRGGATGTAAPDTTTPADTTSSIPTTSSVVPSTTAAITATTEAGSTTIANTGSTAADTTTGVGATTYEAVPDPAAVQGTGAAAAIDFLARLRELSTTVPVLVLPYTDIDAVAAVRAGDPEQVAAAVARGRELPQGLFGRVQGLAQEL